MENINYFYDKSSKIYLYDSSMPKNVFFENELSSESKYILLNKYRYIISPSLLEKVIYISTLEIYEVTDGYMLQIHDLNVLLIPVGKNLYLLASTNAKGIYLESMLYTFMLNKNCVIDVSKYNHLFKDASTKLFMYKKHS